VAARQLKQLTNKWKYICTTYNIRQINQIVGVFWGINEYEIYLTS